MDLLAHNITAIRKFHELTQEEFANLLGYSRSYVKDIESGRSKASRRFLEAFCDQFSFSLETILTSGFEDYIDYVVTTTDEEYFIFIWAFTDEELRAGEVNLNHYLSRKDHITIDANNLKTYPNLLSQIMGDIKPQGQVQKRYKQFCLEGKHSFILLKNLSRSKIPQKGLNLRKLIESSVHQTVIVLDKPSFLEKYHKELYFIAKTTTAP